ncbi:DnaA regulatory inactivator Hda [Catenovulum sp. SM1970]|nr:DnaA regulatory inactivator Hda [Marinifaba aquimaris]NTS76063.1 DnaA regulatory inactivator Hda [Marinifaba aquimaris]
MQLTMDFALDKETSLANYYTFGNEDLLNQLKAFVKEPAEKPADALLFLHSPTGCGKSHLLQALCQYAYEIGISNQYLPLHVFSHYEVEATMGMEQFPLLLIDDIDALKHNPAWQEAIFDLINRVLEKQGKIIFAADNTVENLGLSLPDLISRLQWGQTWALTPLDDEYQIEMMIFRAKCKGMTLSDEVAQYIHTRLSRDPKSIIRCLEKLDKASLEEQRRLTIPFIKQLMRW